MPDHVMGVAAFHGKHGFKAQAPDHLTDAFEIIGLEFEITNRFSFVGINTQCNHQRIGLPCHKLLHRLGITLPPCAKITTTGKWNIKVRALPVIAPGFIGIAHEERKLMGRISME